MARLALQLACVVSAVGFLIPKLAEIFRFEFSRPFELIFYLPAVILGTRSWCWNRVFARSWPVIACILIVWLGIVYRKESSATGLGIAAHLTLVLPISALIVEKRCWILCARTYVLANAFALALAIWFEYQVREGAMFSASFRFGVLSSDRGNGYLANPNFVGAQLATAAVLALVLYLKSGTRPSPHAMATAQPRTLSLGWAVFLSLGCMLTASRSAFFAWLAGTGLLLVWGTRTQEPNRLRNLAAVSGILLCVMLFVMSATGFAPWQSLQGRLARTDRLIALGGRVNIWKAAFDAWGSDPRHMVWGVGTGVANDILAQCALVANPGADGVRRIACHSTFVEWMLSHGLVGMVAGGCLLVAIWRKARQLDCQQRGVSRQAILLCVFLFAMTASIHFPYSWPATGALILAMLSKPPGVAPATAAAHFRRRRSLSAPARPGRVPSATGSLEHVGHVS